METWRLSRRSLATPRLSIFVFSVLHRSSTRVIDPAPLLWCAIRLIASGHPASSTSNSSRSWSLSCSGATLKNISRAASPANGSKCGIGSSHASRPGCSTPRIVATNNTCLMLIIRARNSSTATRWSVGSHGVSILSRAKATGSRASSFRTTSSMDCDATATTPMAFAMAVAMSLNVAEPSRRTKKRRGPKRASTSVLCKAAKQRFDFPKPGPPVTQTGRPLWLSIAPTSALISSSRPKVSGAGGKRNGGGAAITELLSSTLAGAKPLRNAGSSL